MVPGCLVDFMVATPAITPGPIDRASVTRDQGIDRAEQLKRGNPQLPQ
jgi:hypothetical protein